MIVPHNLATSSLFTRKMLWMLAGSAVVALFALVAVGCGNSSAAPVTATSGAATASVMLSDPATCQSPNGPFAHVYVTITDVKASVNSGAGDNDSSFVDLTPSLSAKPMQIDLLGQANNQCFLASLGATTQLQAGNYQQIRIFLADNSATVSGNACNGSANCVVLSTGGNYPLLLSSESKTGIKIPSGQIANGGFNISAGQTKDLDIDFSTCVSIVQEGNGRYRLKPVLHAGEVSTTSTSINGTVVDSVTGNSINGSVLVALEQKDANGIDRVFMSTIATSAGSFVFCPLPSGPYDVVIVAQSTAGVAYAPTVVTGVATGSALSSIKIYAPVGAISPATLKGTVITQVNTSPAVATAADVQLSALEQINSGLTVTIPLLPNSTQSSATLAFSTTSGSSCATGTDCASYIMVLPAATSYVGNFSASGTSLSLSLVAASYTADAITFVPSSGGTLDCTPSEVKSAAILPIAGTTVTVAPLSFTACIAGF